MAKVIFTTIYMDKIWAGNMISQPIFHLCQRVQLLTLPCYQILLSFRNIAHNSFLHGSQNQYYSTNIFAVVIVLLSYSEPILAKTVTSA